MNGWMSNGEWNAWYFLGRGKILFGGEGHRCTFGGGVKVENIYKFIHKQVNKME